MRSKSISPAPTARSMRAINCVHGLHDRHRRSYGVKAVLAPHIPNNEGVLRPITIKAPEGSIANSNPPAAGRCARADRALLADDGDPALSQASARARDGDRRLAAVVHQPVGRRADGGSPSPTCSSQRRLRRGARARRRARAVVAEQRIVDAGRNDRATVAAQSALPPAARRQRRQRRVSRRQRPGDPVRKPRARDR